MNHIILTEHIASDRKLERLNLFAGRQMGEEEFDRSQAYADRRIEPLLKNKFAGIVSGLEIRSSSNNLEEGVTVSPGIAVAGNGLMLGLYYPLRVTWQTLLEEYLSETNAAKANGVFYLTLRRTEAYVDADPTILPCQRTEFDPTRDATRVVVGTLGLQKLGIEPSIVNSTSQSQIENWVAANNVDATFLNSMKNEVPLGLLAVSENTSDNAEDQPFVVSWFSQPSGNYRSIADSGYHVLLQQVNHAFRRALLGADSRPDAMSLITYLEDNLQLDFLPAAGELPKEIISDIDSLNPSIGWLPGHLGVDMVAIPEDTAVEMVERHLPRRVIDLRVPANDRIRLLLAVDEKDYKDDLLDYPQTDKQLESDMYKYFKRAYLVWSEWITKYNQLYFVVDDDVLEPEDLKVLDLPKKVSRPQLPQDFFEQIIEESETEVGLTESNEYFYPYSEGRPSFPSFYQQWGVVTGSGSNMNVMPPPITEPDEDGLVIKYTIAQHELESLDNQIRATRTRLEKTRDYLLLQRQQLDNQTVSMAALAGGVAGDGSGLQVARWLPFTQLKKIDADASEGGGEGGGGETGGDGTGGDGTGGEGSGTVNQTYTPFIQAITPSYINYASKTAASSSVIQNAIQSTSSSKTTLSKSTSQLLSSNTLKYANSNSNLLFASTLRKTPTILSTLQFNLNNSRLDKIAEAPRQALTKPAFEAKEFRFGTLEHVRPEIQEYKKAHRGMRELITTLVELFDKTEANSLQSTLEAYGTIKALGELELPAPARTQEELEQAAVIIYEELFAISKILTHQIAYMEGRYNRIEALLEGKLRARINKEAEIEKLASLIHKATQELEGIDKRRIEFLGDYGVTQRLTDEDWLDVYHLTQERSRILNHSVKGVYFVRERQTSLSKPLADPLALRYGQSDDIVPGCDWDADPELPEELEDFFDTVLEVPMKDWANLNELEPLIPKPTRLKYIYQIRQTRLADKHARKRVTSQLSPRFNRPIKASLFSVRVQSQSILEQMTRISFPLRVKSAKQRAKEAALVMSLEDLVTGTRGKLQNESQKLIRRLEQAIDCLLAKLNELPPSIRLQWAQLAEDDRIRVRNPAFWPGLERAEKDDFNATRTVAELVEWWFKQMDSKASANGKAAMRNMIRATLIQSALGDPSEILEGQVQVPPRLLGMGEPLRLKLNKPVKRGTILQLMDPSQRVVALLNVEDDDDSGTLAQISKVSIKDARIDTSYRVVASQSTRQLLI
ncbi:hypothetical protein FLL45_20365 [Aliikangiella marina]|uniref:Uncharacterized protein n=1 Tax=Aliikangiella marina TaxID=1712262 RepID=A0A545T2S8_9GAMM|nr:hypothetical protein [Aliikangiella marina]TQV71508.1 hypothetical protein FLL45_20365 [Aliikangiella marina]